MGLLHASLNIAGQASILAKTQRELVFVPTYSLQDGLNECISHYRGGIF